MNDSGLQQQINLFARIVLATKNAVTNFNNKVSSFASGLNIDEILSKFGPKLFGGQFNDQQMTDKNKFIYLFSILEWDEDDEISDRKRVCDKMLILINTIASILGQGVGLNEIYLNGAMQTESDIVSEINRRIINVNRPIESGMTYDEEVNDNDKQDTGDITGAGDETVIEVVNYQPFNPNPPKNNADIVKTWLFKTIERKFRSGQYTFDDEDDLLLQGTALDEKLPSLIMNYSVNENQLSRNIITTGDRSKVTIFSWINSILMSGRIRSDYCEVVSGKTVKLVYKQAFFESGDMSINDRKQYIPIDASIVNPNSVTKQDVINSCPYGIELWYVNIILRSIKHDKLQQSPELMIRKKFNRLCSTLGMISVPDYSGRTNYQFQQINNNVDINLINNLVRNLDISSVIKRRDKDEISFAFKLILSGIVIMMSQSFTSELDHLNDRKSKSWILYPMRSGGKPYSVIQYEAKSLLGLLEFMTLILNLYDTGSFTT